MEKADCCGNRGFAPPARSAPPEVFPGAEIYQRLVHSSVWVKTSLSSNRASGWLFDDYHPELGEVA